jgi:hypothetical protein
MHANEMHVHAQQHLSLSIGEDVWYINTCDKMREGNVVGWRLAKQAPVTHL